MEEQADEVELPVQSEAEEEAIGWILFRFSVSLLTQTKCLATY